MLQFSTQFLIPAASLGLLLIAATTDLAWRIIPNRICLLVASLGLVAQILLGQWVAALFGAALVFGICLVLWRCRIIGGGDAKLLPAVALCVPPDNVLTLFMTITLVGAGLGILYLALRPLLRHRAPGLRPLIWWRRALRVERWRIGRGGPLPYGVAIAAGTFLAII